MDAVICIGGCDKNMPGAMIAIARLNIPSLFVYGGTIKPGHMMVNLSAPEHLISIPLEMSRKGLDVSELLRPFDAVVINASCTRA